MSLLFDMYTIAIAHSIMRCSNDKVNDNGNDNEIILLT